MFIGLLCRNIVIFSFRKIVNKSAIRTISGVMGWIALTCLVLCFSTLEAVAADLATLVIRGGAVFDSMSGTMRPNQTVVVEGRKIKWMGESGRAVDIPQDAHVIDARGKYIIPGLIDSHVHLVFLLDAAHITGDEVLPMYLANGVTALRGAGDRVVAETTVAHYAESHSDRCPRIFTASDLIDGDPPIHGNDLGQAVTDPEKVRALVEDMVAWKVTTLKIYAGTRRPVGRRVIEEGHRYGLMVTAHLGYYSAQDAVEDGIDCLEHIWGVFNFILPPGSNRATVDLNNPQAKALIASLAEKKVMVNPTLTVFRNMLLLADQKEVYDNPDNALVPQRLRTNWEKTVREERLTPATLDSRRSEFRKYQELTGMLFRAGVPLLAGTDTPEPYCPPGFALHQELELLVESGLTPAAALQAATINNARALKQDRNLGSIEAGKLADLVILQADPTAEIRNTRRIECVVRDGQICDPKMLLELIHASE
jgi:imidazolonepropionase-like amidohydrolase